MESNNQNSFTVSVDLDNQPTLNITHSEGTYETELNGQTVSIINNGDNSWNLVRGNADQETVNLIGDAIEKYYNAANS